MKMDKSLNLTLWMTDLLGVSSTSIDVDPSSVSGETELNA
jgi:hypothetical protein